MDAEIVQRTRYILRSRFRRAQTCPPALFAPTCRQLHQWLTLHPVLGAHVHGIGNRAGESARQVEKIGSDLAEPRRGSYSPGFYSASTLDEHAAVCLAMLTAIVNVADDHANRFLVTNFGEYLSGDEHIDEETGLQVVRDVALDGLFEYLDEHLDSGNVVLALIAKYRQRAEWFRRESLRGLAQAGISGMTGERSLTMDMYEYLLDQGVEFFVETVTGSGEPDIVLREPQGGYVVVDAKYIKATDGPAEIRRKLASGFHQVARYCDDLQEPIGHLVVYSESRSRLSIDLETDGIRRYLRTAGRIIYYTDIWIADAPSASKLGKAEEIEVSRNDLLTAA